MTNDALVVASRKDPWIRAASTGLAPATPAFIRGGTANKIISFDFYLCSGNGEAVPNDIVEMVFTAATTVVDTSISAGSLIMQESIASGALAENAALLQTGRRVVAKANSVGRVTGSVALFAAADITVIVSYRHIRTSLVTTLVAS